MLSDKELAGRLSENAGKLSEKAKPQKIYEEWKNYVEALTGN